MKIAVLDAATLGGDLDLSPLYPLGEVAVYPGTGAEELAERVADADVIIANKLKLNMETLHKAVGTLHTALGTLRDGANDLLEGSTDLKDGTNQFLEEVAGSENEIGGMVNSIVDSFSGSNVELGSFVSEKNTQVESVQFVIKTAAVNADQAEMETPVVVERLTFWQKLLRLFGLY